MQKSMKLDKSWRGSMKCDIFINKPEAFQSLAMFKLGDENDLKEDQMILKKILCLFLHGQIFLPSLTSKILVGLW